MVKYVQGDGMKKNIIKVYFKNLEVGELVSTEDGIFYSSNLENEAILKQLYGYIGSYEKMMGSVRRPIIKNTFFDDIANKIKGRKGNSLCFPVIEKQDDTFSVLNKYSKFNQPKSEFHFVTVTQNEDELNNV